MHINKINDKKYIGITKDSIEHRSGKNGTNYEKCPYFWKAIQKYGWDNFEHIILFENLTKEEACEKEIALIREYDLCNHELGYNLSKGGDMKNGENNPFFGHTHTEETKNKVRESNKQRIWTEESKQKIRDKLSGSKNKLSKTILCVETNETFGSLKEAATAKRIHYSKISEAANGKRKTAGGYHWKYIDAI